MADRINCRNNLRCVGPRSVFCSESVSNFDMTGDVDSSGGCTRTVAIVAVLPG
jgi:hypothetical protein